ncbi:MAG: 1-(5-phosphoribosyl)-5-[(5-phosphoribosylamino)methylideneamino]imidazole-4-carboxamide isomerase [Desulfosudaceae bacterium]
MIVIPAVDIKNGRCVRLLQGDMNAETVFSDDPAAMAVRWASQGAELIHLVDLDGAVQKRPCNLTAIEKIIDQVDRPVQVGGGIRDMATLRMYLERGVSRVVIGSSAIHDADFIQAACREFPGRIVLGIDARNGQVAIEGWTETTTVTAVDLARKFEGTGLAAVNFTDIHRDGMQTGPNLAAIREFAEAIDIPVVASGGVSTLADIKALAGLRDCGITGVITGRALYEGSLDLAEAIAAARV